MRRPSHTLRSALAAALSAVLLLAGLSAHAQCSDRLVENLRTANEQRLVTAPQLLVVRAGYAYNLALSATQEGVRGLFTSRGGSKPNRGDELLLINREGDRKVFRFVDDLSVTRQGDVPIYGNTLQLDFATVAWLASADVTTVTLIDNSTNQGRRFSIPSSRQAEFRQLVQCFQSAADPSLLPDIPAVATAIPSVRKAVTPPVQRESGLSAKPGTTTLADKRRAEAAAAEQEVVDARATLSAEKQALREQLALERAKAQRAKDRIGEEVTASRKAAEAEKAAIAAEVMAARERAREEIARISAASATQREAIDAVTAKRMAEGAQEVADAQQRSDAAVAATERSAAEAIAEIKAEQAEAAAIERARYAEAQQAYADVLEAARMLQGVGLFVFDLLACRRS